MRISYVATAINTREGGGSHRNTLSQIQTLRQSGHDVEITTIFSSRNALPANISVTEVRGEGKSFFGIARLVADVLSKRTADVNIVYGHALLWGAGYYRIAGRTPTIVYLDNYLDSMPEVARGSRISRFLHTLWRKTMGRRYIQSIDMFIAVSEFLKESYVRAGFPQEKFAVVPNFFELEEHSGATRSDPALLLYVGRLTKEKGIDALLEALRLLPKELPWKARIVGDGEERERVEAAASMDQRITYRGWTTASALVDEYAAAGVFVHPVRWPEPFGRTIVEAMHMSLPVIVPSWGASASIAAGACVEFKNGDAHSLAKAIETLLREPQKARELGKEGARISSHYARAHVAPLFLKMIERVASTRT